MRLHIFGEVLSKRTHIRITYRKAGGFGFNLHRWAAPKGRKARSRDNTMSQIHTPHRITETVNPVKAFTEIEIAEAAQRIAERIERENAWLDRLRARVISNYNCCGEAFDRP